MLLLLPSQDICCARHSTCNCGTWTLPSNAEVLHTGDVGKHPRHLSFMSSCYKPATSQSMLPDTHHTAPIGQEVMQMAGVDIVRVASMGIGIENDCALTCTCKAQAVLQVGARSAPVNQRSSICSHRKPPAGGSSSLTACPDCLVPCVYVTWSSSGTIHHALLALSYTLTSSMLFMTHSVKAQPVLCLVYSPHGTYLPCQCSS